MRMLYSLLLGFTLLWHLPLLHGFPDLASSPHIQLDETPIRQFLRRIHTITRKSGLKGVDCMYVINLRKRPEKWQRIQSICKEYALFPSRVDAIDGSQISPETVQMLFGPYPIRLALGQIGCSLSHISIYLDSYNRQFNCIWVCEDDIDFLGNPLQMPDLINELSKIDPDWDILYTDSQTVIPACYGWGCGNTVCNRLHDFRPDQLHQPLEYYLSDRLINAHFTFIGQRYGSYSYFISKKGIQKLVDYFLHVYFWSSLDVDIHYVPYIRQYVLNKPVISHWIDSGTNDTLQIKCPPLTVSMEDDSLDNRPNYSEIDVTDPLFFK